MIRCFALLLLLGLVTAACGADDEVRLFEEDSARASADYEYTIPAGSGEAIDRGESLDILPVELDVHVGEVIQIVNEDDRGHLVGPFYVGAGETLRQRFSTAGTFIGVCTVHPSGQIRLRILDP